MEFTGLVKILKSQFHLLRDIYFLTCILMCQILQCAITNDLVFRVYLFKDTDNTPLLDVYAVTICQPDRDSKQERE